MVQPLNCNAAIFFCRTKGVMAIFRVLSTPNAYTLYSLFTVSKVQDFQHLKGALLTDENVLRSFAKQLSATENYKSNSCEFHLVASGRMSIWQLASVRRYLHCLKVDGDGEENQCGCKQCNGRVMCSPGQATQKKSCWGNAKRKGKCSCRFYQPFPLPHSIHSTCTSQLLKSVFKAVFSCCLFRMLTLQGHQSKQWMLR